MSRPFSLHRDAALRTGRKRPPRPGPVTTVRVNRAVWATALRLARGDPRLIEIVSATHVIVSDPREG